MDLQLKEAEPPARRTLTASPAMKARIEKASAPPPKPPAQHAVHKSPKTPAVAQPKPVPAQKATVVVVVEEDPAVISERRARLERRSALVLRLRAVSPTLFAPDTYIPVPLAVGIHEQIIEALGCEPRDVTVILGMWCAKFRYQKALTQPGAIRRNLDGSEAGSVTEEQRLWAMERLEKLKAKRRAKSKAEKK